MPSGGDVHPALTQPGGEPPPGVGTATQDRSPEQQADAWALEAPTTAPCGGPPGAESQQQAVWQPKGSLPPRWA